MRLEIMLVWACINLYALASMLLLTGFVFNKERLIRIAGYMILPAFLAHAAVFFNRWITSGYFPANGDLENAITSGFFAVALTIFLYVRNRELTGIALFTIPVTLLLLGYGVMSEPNPMPVEVSYKSNWLIIHVFFAQLAYGSYAVASGMGLMYVMKDNKIAKGEALPPLYEKIPRLEMLEENMFRFVIYGFISEAIMIVAGAIWAKDLWGSYWAWDPVEVWSLVSWLLYGLAIHLKVTLGWKGRRLAWLMIVLILSVIITYWGIDLVVENTRHIFGVMDVAG